MPYLEYSVSHTLLNEALYENRHINFRTGVFYRATSTLDKGETVEGYVGNLPLAFYVRPNLESFSDKANVFSTFR